MTPTKNPKPSPDAAQWEVRLLSGTLALRNPMTGKVLITSGGYALVDPAYREDPVGPFRTRKAATDWASSGTDPDRPAGKAW